MQFPDEKFNVLFSGRSCKLFSSGYLSTLRCGIYESHESIRNSRGNAVIIKIENTIFFIFLLLLMFSYKDQCEKILKQKECS